MFEAPRPQSLSAVCAHGLLLGGAGAAVFLAGGTAQGNLGVFLLCAGIALVSCPPRVRVEWQLWAATGGLALCAGLAFLPARWLPVPLWRKVIAETPVVTLPSTITPAPAETAFWLALLVLSMVVGLFALSQPVRARSMGWLVLAAVTTCAVYAGLAIYAKMSGWNYPFSGGASFGFFPNRNHTATLLITGSVLSASLMSVAFRDRRWFVADAAVAGGLVCVVALFFFSESRAGVLVLFVGLALWLAGLGGRHRPAKLRVAAVVVAVTAGGLFLVAESPARDRLLNMVGMRVGAKALPTPATVYTQETTVETGAGGILAVPMMASRARANLPSEFRLAIYRDALDMIRDQPWTGTGLGTFAGVFPQYRRASLLQYNALHPESDWLMLVAEAGLPAFFCAAALVAVAARRLIGIRNHPYWPLRWGCAAGSGIALLHGALDVPVHRVALGWWVLVLAGLALQKQSAPGEGLSEENSWQVRVQRAVFALGGVGALVLGGLLVRGEWFHGAALPPFAVEGAPQRIFDAYEHKDYDLGMALAKRTLTTAPLTASVYYYIGVLRAVTDDEGVDTEVDEMFRAERILDPVMPDVPHRQALAWAGYDPARQAAMTMDELGRMGRINRETRHGSSKDLQFFGELVARAALQTDLQRYLLAVTRPDHRFGVIWSHMADPTLVSSKFEELMRDDEWWQQTLKTRAVSIQPDWYLRRESAEPPLKTEALGDNDWARELKNAGWAVRMRQMVNAHHYDRAVDALSERFGISLALPDATGAVKGAESGPAAEFIASWCSGDYAKAKHELMSASVDVTDPASLEIWRWQAAIAKQNGNCEQAWLALERYVRHTRQMEWQ